MKPTTRFYRQQGWGYRCPYYWRTRDYSEHGAKGSLLTFVSLWDKERSCWVYQSQCTISTPPEYLQEISRLTFVIETGKDAG